MIRGARQTASRGGGLCRAIIRRLAGCLLPVPGVMNTRAARFLSVRAIAGLGLYRLILPALTGIRDGLYVRRLDFWKECGDNLPAHH